MDDDDEDEFNPPFTDRTENTEVFCNAGEDNVASAGVEAEIGGSAVVETPAAPVSKRSFQSTPIARSGSRGGGQAGARKGNSVRRGESQPSFMEFMQMQRMEERRERKEQRRREKRDFQRQMMLANQQQQSMMMMMMMMSGTSSNPEKMQDMVSKSASMTVGGDNRYELSSSSSSEDDEDGKMPATKKRKSTR